MNLYPIIKIKNSRLPSINRKHPWIFSGGVIKCGEYEDGDIVEVHSQKGIFQCIAYFQEGSIMLRILSFEREKIDEVFWSTKIKKAYQLRNKLGFPSPQTNGYRLFNGEGDGIPGLVIDVYNNIAVIQCHTIGIHRQIEAIFRSIDSEIEEIDTIFDKSSGALPDNYNAKGEDGFIKGSQKEVTIQENGNAFKVNLFNSQKTGFFLDQRNNRNLLAKFSKGRSVLNLYAYTGGFSVYALKAGALRVVSVDISSTAIEMLEENVQLTGNTDRHTSEVKDVKNYFKEIESGEFDIIVVDPPAFAKSKRKKHNAVQAYKRINKMAIEKVKAGGLIFTFSCSQVVIPELFYNTITAAAIEAGREVRILYRLSQGPDHPVNIYHPEGNYLKGLVISVE